MCGIAGIIARDPRFDFDGVLGSMQRAVGHRGPDQDGVASDRCGEWRIGLAHTRLSILDLSPAGRQPMSHMSRWITYNGEVYNFQELRRDLAGPFQSSGDTEVLLKAFAAWGVGALSRFRGMFALGIWDTEAHQLVLARDPLGIKPLYIWQRGDVLLFASEVRALLASGLVPRKLSRNGMLSFLRNGSVDAPWTAIEGVTSLRPGEMVVAGVGPRGLELRREMYFSLTTKPGREGITEREKVADELLDVLSESVRLHMVSDVPVGVFLSGGLDSSAIVALAARASREPLRTFSVCFREAEFSEADFARIVARRFKTDHSEVMLSEENLLELLPEALDAMDQPTSDGINTFVISRAVRATGIPVALSGLGGDEIFAGYPSFRRAARIRRLAYVPKGARRCAAAVGRSLLNGSVERQKFWDLIGSEATPLDAYSISRRLFSGSEIRTLAGSEAPSCDDGGALPDDPVNAVSLLELQGYMANTLLRDSDFMSMAHALELRVPFVDVEVVRYLAGIPGAWKLDGRVPKPLLVGALKSLMPEEVWRRPKMGFTLPLRRWMQSALRPKLDVAFASGSLRTLGMDDAAAQAVWTRFLSAPAAERWTRPWSLYVLQRWCTANEVRA